ncbi:hypothetical protein KFL_001750020 [Klebsormidium nitens]|uniref:BLOC-1-related complex subunit 6 C-terminal helix domain-containing protein n=1 Tax=Klebsormidium nitens TaxID=105231 RepID=A0A1Y1HZI7_KLENI|nr:hypothetical protein KFL_001750020 [Klebsormidium nitens]|eukprot:GAQ84065.1 hypothetical protein KFL_001750020 [Klebsormidium nitens]
MPHQKEEVLKSQASSSQQNQGTDIVKQTEKGAAGEDANLPLQSNESTRHDLEQRLLTYARRLQGASSDPERPSELRASDDPFSIQMPLNRTTSRMSIPVAVEVLAEVEKDASNVANNLVQLMATLRASLADVTHCSLEHLECHSEAARELHEAVTDAASSGNRFINECQRLDQEMRDVGELAAQIKAMRQLVDHFEGQLNRHLPSR